MTTYGKYIPYPASHKRIFLFIQSPCTSINPADYTKNICTKMEYLQLLGSRLIGWLSFSKTDKACIPDEPAYNDREATDHSSSGRSAGYTTYNPTLAEVCDMFKLKYREAPTVQCPARDHISIPPELGRDSPPNWTN